MSGLAFRVGRVLLLVVVGVVALVALLLGIRREPPDLEPPF